MLHSIFLNGGGALVKNRPPVVTKSICGPNVWKATGDKMYLKDIKNCEDKAEGSSPN